MVDYALELLEKRNLPTGLLRRATDATVVNGGQIKQAQTILRDAYNNARLIEETGSTTALRPSQFVDQIDILANREKSRVEMPPAGTGDHSALLYVLSRLRHFRKWDEFKGFLNRLERQIVIDGVQDYIFQTDIVEKIKNGVHPDHYVPRFRDLLPGTTEFISFMLSLAGRVLGGLTGEEIIVSSTNLIKYKPILQRLGIAELDTPGIEWVNVLVTGGPRIRSGQLPSVVAAIKSLSKEDQSNIESILREN